MKSRTRIRLKLIFSTIILLDAACAAGFLRQLKFSEDGKFVLAQSDDEITVVEMAGFKVVLRLRAVGVTRAQFGPDSDEVVFITSMSEAGPWQIRAQSGTPHVERWSIGDRKRKAFTAVPQLLCETLVLARTARTFACGSPDGTLRVVDVPSGQTILQKAKFATQRHRFENDESGNSTDFPKVDLGLVRIEFSPNGRFLIAHPILGDGRVLIWDVVERHAVKAAGKLRSLRAGDFDFVGPDRLVMSWSGCSGWNCVSAIAGIVEMPSGKVLSTTKIPVGRTLRPADPAFLVVRPNPRWRNEIMTWKDTTVIRLSDGQPIPIGPGEPIKAEMLFDVFGDFSVTEVRPRELGLWERGKGLKASVALGN